MNYVGEILQWAVSDPNSKRISILLSCSHCLSKKTAVCSSWKSGSDLVLSYLIPTGFYVFHKWLKKSSQLEIAIKSFINSWLAPASGSSLDSHSAQSRGLWSLPGQEESLDPIKERAPWPAPSLGLPGKHAYVVSLFCCGLCCGPSRFPLVSAPHFSIY